MILKNETWQNGLPDRLYQDLCAQIKIVCDICGYGKAGAGIDGCSAPDTASKIVIDDEAGAGIDGCCAPDTASEFY